MKKILCSIALLLLMISVSYAETLEFSDVIKDEWDRMKITQLDSMSANQEVKTSQETIQEPSQEVTQTACDTSQTNENIQEQN